MAKESALAESASTWMQVVFGGLGLSVAIVGLIIAYFAWVQPHSSADDDKVASSVPAGGTGTTAARSGPTAPAGAKQVALRGLAATTGGSNVRPDGDDLTMPCGSGQSTDRQRTVEYDLLGNYATLTADLTVTKARDGDTPLQVAVLVDDRGAGTYTLTRGTGSRRLDLPLTGAGRLRLQLICQFPDGEIRFGNPLLTHV